MKKILLVALFALAISGCNEKQQEIQVKSETGPSEVRPVATAVVSNPAENGSLSGRVLFEGQAPVPAEVSIAGNPECSIMHAGGKVASEELLVDNGDLANAFVYIKEGLEGRTFPVPAEAAIISNKGCVYLPHVSGVQVGQSVQLLNEDPTLHNIHSYSTKGKSWNLGLPFLGMKVMKKFDTAEVMVQLKCDVHPWMVGYVGVLPHPYFAVSGKDGSFQIKDVPPGQYTIEVWHEKLGVRSQTIKIEPREVKTVDFQYS